MERKFLEELGLEKEAIDKVMAEHGKGVNAAKGDLDTKIKEVETLQGQLVTANKEIEGFKELNIDEIRLKTDKYKEDYEKLEKQSKEEIDKMKFEHMLESKLINAGAKDVKVAKAILNIEELRSSNNQETDIETAITKAKETHSYVYKDSDPVGTGGSMGNMGKSKLPTITKEDFNKMSYKEKVDLYNKQPEIYKKLNE